ncbi:hypothetical protein NOK12_23680 [Nocardioides sp. OK12]|uniref:MXAN_6640 family putative metalloprotease n=1 Tax=Nocardioides sp. OK12 TaxID=2758661 RepID=UPI0021C31C7C|nr:MXAN_6640 family putative metalloprotease [Nocardioides sp. OK12]GHJ59850.1 hypothetical protein NOK12_23680 [Nocardioides sp. OK12]
MRRRPATPLLLSATLVTLAATLALGSTPGAAALGTQSAGTQSVGAQSSGARLSSAPAGAGTDPDEALAAARTALGLSDGAQSRGPGQPVGEGNEATMALRDLRVALPQLGAEQRREGEALLARPTDGGDDPVGQGYHSRSKKLCSGNVCVHYVTKGADRPDSQKWVRKTLQVMNKVWDFETGTLGYRKPVSDRSLPQGKNGGNGKFDVYLKELSGQRLYGYCAPEYLVKGNKRLANGYCVLDDDFAKAEYGRKPLDTLRVTAAHEFFHAIQFNYDYREDRWLLESTATWVEERFADDVNDNRQYLPVGQVRVPDEPLDIFSTTFGRHYGNWAWWEFLTQKYGGVIVRSVWKQAGQFKAAGRDYSTRALTKVLAGKGGFSRNYARFAAVNNNPAAFYPEGASWPSAARIANLKLSKDATRKSQATTVDHMSAQNVDVTPAAELKDKAWTLRLTLDGPAAATKPMAAVLVQNKTGAWDERLLGFNRKGRARLSVPFSARRVDAVTVSLVNTSTSFDCWEDQAYSCAGIADHDAAPFQVTAKAFKDK